MLSPRERRPEMPPLPSLGGVSMSPRAWGRSEFTKLAAGAPAMTPRRPAAAERAELDVATDAAEAEAADATETPRKGTSLAAAVNAVRLGHRIGGDEASGALAEYGGGSGFAEEAALASGELTGARTCQALLSGELHPRTFALCVAAIPDDKLPLWLDGFGR